MLTEWCCQSGPRSWPRNIYRCYLVKGNHIALGDNVEADTLRVAIGFAHDVLAAQPNPESFDAIEIWQSRNLICRLRTDGKGLGPSGNLGGS
jgi:hypothetical protein